MRGSAGEQFGYAVALGGWQFSRLLIALVLVISCLGANAYSLPGFILSPSATLRVAGLAPRVKVEHPTV